MHSEMQREMPEQPADFTRQSTYLSCKLFSSCSRWTSTRVVLSARVCIVDATTIPSTRRRVSEDSPLCPEHCGNACKIFRTIALAILSLSIPMRRTCLEEYNRFFKSFSKINKLYFYIFFSIQIIIFKQKFEFEKINNFFIIYVPFLALESEYKEHRPPVTMFHD